MRQSQASHRVSAVRTLLVVQVMLWSALLVTLTLILLLALLLSDPGPEDGSGAQDSRTDWLSQVLMLGVPAVIVAWGTWTVVELRRRPRWGWILGLAFQLVLLVPYGWAVYWTLDLGRHLLPMAFLAGCAAVTGLASLGLLLSPALRLNVFGSGSQGSPHATRKQDSDAGH
ncbi:MAG: hypothetical protein GEV03_18560 [Streptosporangiales bacterium]|nr:hypothetical protein [Streptosporangiales bacterium]